MNNLPKKLKKQLLVKIKLQPEWGENINLSHRIPILKNSKPKIKSSPFWEPGRSSYQFK